LELNPPLVHHYGEMGNLVTVGDRHSFKW
jgi:hypothetical protein